MGLETASATAPGTAGVGGGGGTPARTLQGPLWVSLSGKGNDLFPKGNVILLILCVTVSEDSQAPHVETEDFHGVFLE